MERKRALIVGGGPAGLMAAQTFARAGWRVSLYEAMPSAGRKFLVAGHGGLNLTHSEELARFTQRYGKQAPRFERWLREFSPADVRRWCAELGIETFVGSSGRVFPKDMKAAPLLKAWSDDLKKLGVEFHVRERWIGFSESGMRFADERGRERVEQADATVLALGGASWPQTGSDGSWTKIFAEHGIAVVPFEPSNCGFEIAWSPAFLNGFDTAPIKNVALSCGQARSNGEIMLTSYGIEGGAVYALSGDIRSALQRDGQATVGIDLKPDLSADQLREKLGRPRKKQTWANFLRKSIHLSAAAFRLLREKASAATLSDPAATAGIIKRIELSIKATRPIAEAISSAGGVDWSEVDDLLMLKRVPGVFVAGEMLDWEAPTGGYLLQGAISTGFAAAQGAMNWMKG